MKNMYIYPKRQTENPKDDPNPKRQTHCITKKQTHTYNQTNIPPKQTNIHQTDKKTHKQTNRHKNRQTQKQTKPYQISSNDGKRE